MSQPPPKPDDTIGWVTVRMHAAGTISIQGTIGDRDFAVSLLEHARDAVMNQIRPRDQLLIPGRDVESVPYAGLREVGDMAPTGRGDA